MSDERIQSYEEFWPFYLSEHRDPRSRRLHFVGTSGFLASVVGSALTTPATFVPAMAGFAAVLADGMRRGESERPNLKHVAGMLGAGAVGSPMLFPAGVVFAYGCAWIGHFGYEKNTPATFKYPLWSLVSDFKMYSLMLRGRLWSGDPLEELGLADPTAAEEEPRITGARVHA
ncbi:MAG: Mpo1-like protein [Sandaracinaceae bacterium]